jgi:hypothetical protein
MGTLIEKDLFVETLRGLAITLVVIGHVIGSASDGGMQVSDDSFLSRLLGTALVGFSKTLVSPSDGIGR